MLSVTTGIVMTMIPGVTIGILAANSFCAFNSSRKIWLYAMKMALSVNGPK